MKTALLLASLIVLSSLGEILSARAMKQVGEVSLQPRELLRAILRMVTNRTLMLAVFFLALSFFSFLSLLSYADLSYVLPLTAVSYVTNTIGARLWLGEHVSRARWLGTALVMCGVAIVSLPEQTGSILGNFIKDRFVHLVALLSPTGEMFSREWTLMNWLLFSLRAALLLCVIAALIYYAASLAAGWLWSRDRQRQRALGTQFTPPVSILIPVRGADAQSYENFASFCRNDYPEFQLVFGVRDQNDPAIAVIERLRRDFPERQIELVISANEIGWNAKVSNLQNMSARLQHEFLFIVDSDIRVGQDYLRRVIAPLQQAHVGMVTCLYRGTKATTFAARLENIGLASSFAPEVATARALEGIRFAFGSTIATRREVLEKIGGFAAVADFLADDFLLGYHTAAAGYEIVLSDYIVEHVSSAQTFAALIKHQLRWGRAMRISRPKGYAGLILTYGLATSLLFLLVMKFASFAWLLFVVTLAMRLLVAWCFGVAALADRELIKNFWLVPLRDLLGFAVWLASFFGNQIEWRDHSFQVLPDGRIRPVNEP